MAENSDVVFSIVGFPSDVQQVMFGDKGVIAGMKKGGIIVDMTTRYAPAVICSRFDMY